MNGHDQAKLLIREAVEAGRAGDAETARSKLSQAVKLDADNADGWFWLGFYLEDPARRLQCAQRALKLNPEHANAQKLLSKVQSEMAAEDDPFADLNPVQGSSAGAAQPGSVPSGQAAAQLSAAASAAAREVGQQLRSEFSGENRRNLLRAWLAALRFDSDNSYERYRETPKPVFTAVLMAIIFAVTPVILLVFTILANGGFRGADFGDVLEILLRTLLGSLLLAVQMVLALYIASYVSAYIGRIRFGSGVTTNQHFGLSGLFYVPVSLLFIVIVVGTDLLGRIFSALLTFQGRALLPTAVSYTLFAFFVYMIAQFVFTNAAIHRVNTWQAVIIAGVSLLVAGLVFFWLLPLTLPLISL